MRTLLNVLREDEAGFIISAELVIVATVVVLALVVGWNSISGAMVGELVDISTALGSLDQSFNYNGISHPGHATCSGSGFNDLGNNVVLGTNTQITRGGGGGTITGSIAGGGRFSGRGDFSGGGGGFSEGGGSSERSAAPRSVERAEELPPSLLDTITEVGPETIVSTDDELVRVEVRSESATEAAPRTRRNRNVETRAVETDDCEALKKKVGELCKELQRIKRADAKAAEALKPEPESER